MIQPRRELDLAQKPLPAERLGKVAVQHLDGDVTPVLAIVRKVDGGHPALAELAAELVSVGEELGSMHGGKVRCGRWSARIQRPQASGASEVA